MVDVGPTLTASWEFEEGTFIAPGRSVLQRFHTNSELYDTYLVWDEQRFAIMVAKVVRPDRIGDDSARRGVRREWRALKQLQHPVVVRGFDVVHDGSHPHVLLEHLEGFTLRQVPRREGPLPIEQVLPLALHIASALHFFSGQGYVHMDVKPSNIIMSAPPRLIDLSLVYSVKEARGIRHLVGTDAYMAPEQCIPGKGPPIGPAADVFGLAATLQHACTGAVPFPRPAKDERYSLADRFPQLEDEPAVLPAFVPEPLREIIGQGLQRQPEDRPTASELARALEPLVAELPHRFVITKWGWKPRGDQSPI
jgi:eukaryotic-like serine/threonine-protein kinase